MFLQSFQPQTQQDVDPFEFYYNFYLMKERERKYLFVNLYLYCTRHLTLTAAQTGSYCCDLGDSGCACCDYAYQHGFNAGYNAGYFRYGAYDQRDCKPASPSVSSDDAPLLKTRRT